MGIRSGLTSLYWGVISVAPAFRGCVKINFYTASKTLGYKHVTPLELLNISTASKTSLPPDLCRCLQSIGTFLAPGAILQIGFVNNRWGFVPNSFRG